MRLKVSFFGYLLGLAGLVLPSVIFAAILPSLINADPVKDRLIAGLQDWTGSQIELSGPVSIGSFFSLSVDLRNVEFKGFKNIPKLKAFRVREIIARISWMDLLSGNLNFDRIKFLDAEAELHPIASEEAASVLLAAFAGPEALPFATFVLKNCLVTVDGPGELENRRLSIERVVADLRTSDRLIELGGRLTWKGEDLTFEAATHAPLAVEGVAPAPLEFSLSSRLLTASFKGWANLAGRWTGLGEFSTSTPDAKQLTDWLGVTQRPLIAQPASAAGTLSLSGTRLALQSTQFSLAGEKASGDLNIGLHEAALKIDGSIALDDIDLEKLWALAARSDRPSAGQAPPSSNPLQDAALDVRISVNRSHWNTLTLGAAAFTLTGKSGMFSTEIADLSVFGGSVLGHVELDLTGETARARARLTAENIEAFQILGFVSQPNWLTGEADANIEAEGEGKTAAELFASTRLSARISFPEGGEMRLDVPRLARSPLPYASEGWDGGAFTQTRFDRLRLHLTQRGNGLRFDDLELLSGAGMVRGSGEIDIAERLLDWQLWFWPQNGETAGNVNAPPKNSPEPLGNLSIKGPWARPAVRLVEPFKRTNSENGFAGNTKSSSKKL